MGLEKLRIYLACDNVWTWSKRQGLVTRVKASVVQERHPIMLLSVLFREVSQLHFK